MDIALEEARDGAQMDEVPVGAVLLGPSGEVLARAHNLRESRRDPTAHAEILVIQEGSRVLGRWRLSGCTLVATLEPCLMCAGAAILARVDTLVYGADDPKAGAVGSLYHVTADERLNHRIAVVAGVKAESSRALLQTFFRAKRP